MNFIAHSSDLNKNIVAQLYEDHIKNTFNKTMINAMNITPYIKNKKSFMYGVLSSSLYHDMGKLDEINQKALYDGNLKHLPLNHVDAGVAYLMQNNNYIAALLVYSHHIGLPSLPKEQIKNLNLVFRDINIMDHTNKYLKDYVKIHHEIVKNKIKFNNNDIEPLTPLGYRIALSCLVDADRNNTECYYQTYKNKPIKKLNAKERLKKLDQYVDLLSQKNLSKRNILRKKIYNICKNANTNTKLYICDSPVGTGKTTSIMAYLLNAAHKNKLRRIFVILPYTSIIDQSVDIYRKALILDNENGEEIIGAHHHKAEYDCKESRHLSFNWDIPIIVTTAVQFFETLASNKTSALRKLHNLPGSAILFDEAHDALPLHLWPQAWKWINELINDWGCHVVLASGSLNKFWTLKEFSNNTNDISNLINKNISIFTKNEEKNRINYKTNDKPLDQFEFIHWIHEFKGPRVVILNTIQSAAFIANLIKKYYGRDKVEHLSTALSPKNRKKTIDKIHNRLYNIDDDNWSLVATSCVEAGMNFSFRIGFREQCRLSSLIQLSGRVNRSGEFDTSDVWNFKLKYNDVLKQNPSFDTSSLILNQLFQENKISQEYLIEAMEREIQLDGLDQKNKIIQRYEETYDFPEVNKNFKVIEDNSIMVVVCKKIINKIELNKKISKFELQNNSVSIPINKKDLYNVIEFDKFPGLYKWTLAYNTFIGYMDGVLNILN